MCSGGLKPVSAPPSSRSPSSSTPSTRRCRTESVSKRQTVVDAAMKMADRLVHTQYDFLRRVVDDAGRSLTKSDGDKK
jgi:hypothetical protein